MDEIVVTDIMFKALIGGVSGAAAALIGYMQAVRQDKKEKFDYTKAGISTVIGIGAGALIATGYVDYDMALFALQAMGLGIVGERVLKSVFPKKSEIKK